MRCPFNSKILIDRLSLGIAMRPLEDTANRLTAESVLIVKRGDRIFLNSQILTDLSSLPLKTLSSLVNIVDVTVSMWP
jgi:hypothetical protein